MKAKYVVTDEYASDKGIKCRWHVKGNRGELVNANAMHKNDAETLCSLINENNSLKSVIDKVRLIISPPAPH